jgi:predicted thioesterase
VGPAPGLISIASIVVADSDTATAMGSGDVPVLATPRLLALAEAAAVAAIAPALDPGLTSVGTSAALEHKRPSPVGAEVEVEAELAEVDGRRLVFRFIARQKPPAGSPGEPAGSPGEGDADEVVGAGTMERVLVDREHFISRARRQVTGTGG